MTSPAPPPPPLPPPTRPPPSPPPRHPPPPRPLLPLTLTTRPSGHRTRTSGGVPSPALLTSTVPVPAGPPTEKRSVNRFWATPLTTTVEPAWDVGPGAGTGRPPKAARTAESDCRAARARSRRAAASAAWDARAPATPDRTPPNARPTRPPTRPARGPPAPLRPPAKGPPRPALPGQEKMSPSPSSPGREVGRWGGARRVSGVEEEPLPLSSRPPRAPRAVLPSFLRAPDATVAASPGVCESRRGRMGEEDAPGRNAQSPRPTFPLLSLFSLSLSLCRLSQNALAISPHDLSSSSRRVARARTWRGGQASPPGRRAAVCARGVRGSAADAVSRLAACARQEDVRRAVVSICACAVFCGAGVAAHEGQGGGANSSSGQGRVSGKRSEQEVRQHARPTSSSRRPLAFLLSLPVLSSPVLSSPLLSTYAHTPPHAAPRLSCTGGRGVPGGRRGDGPAPLLLPRLFHPPVRPGLCARGPPQGRGRGRGRGGRQGETGAAGR